MKLEMSTEMLPIVVPDTYGSGFCYEIAENMWDDFKALMMLKARDYIIKALSEINFKAIIYMVGFTRPREYNFRTDRIDFDMEVDDGLIEVIRNTVNDNFFEYVKKYGSRSGFISFYPVDKGEFYEALNGKRKDKLALAVSMYIMWQLKDEIDLDEWQSDYIEDVWDYANSNGYFEDFDED